jgi:tetratricopeptide (TPR) repeat protein
MQTRDAWVGKGDADRALTDFNAAIKYDPAMAIAYGNRGYLYYRKRDMAHAIELRLGDKAGAIADFRKALELRPDLSTARAGLQQLGANP